MFPMVSAREGSTVYPYDDLYTWCMCGRAYADMGHALHECHLVRRHALYKNVDTLMESHDLPRTGSAKWRILSATWV